MEQLIDAAHNRLIEMLIRYGNKDIGARHKAALKAIITTYAEVVHGKLSGRLAYPLNCGLGKTTSIVAFAKEAHKRSYFMRESRPFNIADNFSIAVAAEKVEALCDLKRQMIGEGIPESMIGLLHSYRHDPAMAKEFIENPNGKLKTNYASESATDDNNERPILLVTHAKIKGAKKSKEALDAFYSFKKAPRSLTIWDESLIKSKADGVSQTEINLDIKHLEGLCEQGQTYLRPALNLLLCAKELMNETLKKQELDGKLQKLNLSEQVTQSITDAIMAFPAGESRMVATKALLGFSQEDFLVAKTYDSQDIAAYIHFELVIPDELQNVVILDASHSLRSAVTADSGIENMAHGADDLVAYSRVKVHQMYENSGRTTMDLIARGKHPTKQGMVKDIADMVEKIPAEDGILFFTYKPRWYPGFYKPVDFMDQVYAELSKRGNLGANR